MSGLGLVWDYGWCRLWFRKWVSRQEEADWCWWQGGLGSVCGEERKASAITPLDLFGNVPVMNARSSEALVLGTNTG